MKIKETIERDCCDTRKDLVFMKKDQHHTEYFFCKFCGRHWETERYMDAAGSSDTRLIPIKWPWEV